MPETEQAQAGYSVIISSIRHGAQMAVANAEIAKVLAIDVKIAGSIVKRAPIILFKDMSKEEVDLAKPHLVALARVGLDFKITMSPPVNVPKVNWPTKPDYLALFREPPPESPVQVLPKTVEVSVQVICPCCGSSLQLHILPLGAPFDASKIKAEEILPAQALAQAAQPATAEVRPPAQAPAAAETATGAAAEPVPAAPAAQAAAPAAPAAPVQPAEIRDALPLAEEEYAEPWKKDAYDAVPVTAREDDLDWRDAPGLDPAVLAEAQEAPPEIEAVEPADSGEMLEKVEVASQDELGGVEKGEELEPWTGKAREYKPAAEEKTPAPAPAKADKAAAAESGTEAEEKEEDLEPWTGKAREYKPAKEEKAPAAVPARAEKAAAAEPGTEAEEKEEDLEPWTGKAREYKPVKEEKAPAAVPSKAERAPAKSAEEEPPVEDDEVTVANADLEPWTGKARTYKAKEVAAPSETSTTTSKNEAISHSDLLAEPAEKGTSGENLSEEGLDEMPVIEPVEAEPVEAEPAPAKKKEIDSPSKALKKIEKKPEAEEEKPLLKKKPPAESAESDEGGAYSVFLSKISSSKKKETAVDLLCEIKGISKEEAETLSDKMIIPVVKGVGKDKAEEILNKFRAVKIPGRITKKK